LPSDAPGAERRGLPVVFLEADVVLGKLDADGASALEIKILNIGRRRLKYYLKLQVLVQPVGILAVAAVRRTTAGLHIGHPIGLGTKDTEKCLRVHSACADLDVIGLLKNAIAVGPEFFKL